jgi:hypothetical protein
VSCPRFELLLLPVLLGCRVGDDPLTRLAEVWGSQNTDAASSPMSSSLKLAALLTDLCASQTDPRWTEASVGAAPPLEPAVAAVLGHPELLKLAGALDGTFQLTLSGATLLDRDDVEVRLAGTAADEDYVASAEAWTLGVDGDAYQFGGLTVAAQRRCTLHQGLWRGSSTWEDQSGAQHALTLGGGDDDESSLAVSAEEPLVPVSGKARWSGEVDEEPRSFSSYDAEDFLVEDSVEAGGGDSGGAILQVGLWPGLARGEDWSVEVNLPVDP